MFDTIILTVLIAKHLMYNKCLIIFITGRYSLMLIILISYNIFQSIKYYSLNQLNKRQFITMTFRMLTKILEGLVWQKHSLDVPLFTCCVTLLCNVVKITLYITHSHTHTYTPTHVCTYKKNEEKYNNIYSKLFSEF